MRQKLAGKRIKLWADWSAGIGHLVDDGRTPGMYYASGLLGLRGELRPAPVLNPVATGIAETVMSYNMTAAYTEKQTLHSIIKPAGSTTPSRVGAVTTGAAATFAYTVAAGDNECLFVVSMVDKATSPTGITYAGAAMTKVVEATGAGGSFSLWRIVNPTLGANNVVITHATATVWDSFACAYQDVHQTVPTSGATNASVTAGTKGPINTAVTTVANGMIIGAFHPTAGFVTVDREQTEIANFTGTYRIVGSERAVPAALSDFHFQYFAEAQANTDPAHPFLYAVRGFRQGAYVTLHKIDLENATFGTFEAGSAVFDVGPGNPFPGQPAKYQGFWWWPAGNDNTPRKLSVVGTGDATTDTLDAVATPFVPGADHLAILGDQMVGVVKQGVAGVPGYPGVGDQDGGVRILKVDGVPSTAADWGQEFPVGEITERAAGLITIEGATFVLNVDGLYSFNNKGRSRLVFEDFRQWRNIHRNIPMSARGGGLVISHPTGLLFFFPGERPVNVGVDKAEGLRAIPPSGVTELHGGLFHSTTTIGDYEYSVYQPNLTSTNVLILCDYPRSDDPRDLVWQVLGTATLQDIEAMLGVHAATSGRPLSANHVTPTVWFGDGADLKYVVLDGKAGPFRSRADTHKVTLSAEAYMSDLRFTEPMDLSGIIVRTSTDMVAGDEFQISLIADGTGQEKNVGWIKGGGAYHVLTLDRHSVTSLVLRVKWTATDATARVPPVIHAIELYGSPTQGQQSRGEE